MGNGNNTVNISYGSSYLGSNIYTGDGSDTISFGFNTQCFTVNTGGGDDTINIGSYKVTNNAINSGDGNDTYNIKLGIYDTFNTIFDSSGTDAILFSDTAPKANLSFYINVKSDRSYENDLTIYNNYNSKFLIQDYMGEGKIETIQSSDGYTIDYSKFANIIQQVASWLSTSQNHYGSVQEVIDSGNTTDISTVISKFTTAWVK